MAASPCEAGAKAPSVTLLSMVSEDDVNVMMSFVRRCRLLSSGGKARRRRRSGDDVRRRWDEEEDEVLRQFVEEHGPKEWAICGQRLSRKAKQCRERWYQHLRPGICKSDWSLAEDLLLLELIEHHREGKVIGWVGISKAMETPEGIRPDNQCKNRYSTLKRHGLYSVRCSTLQMPLPTRAAVTATP